MSGEHNEGSDEKSLATTELLDGEESGEGRDNIDSAEDDLDEEGVLDSGRGEELDSVREEEVDSRPLLTGLDGNLRERERVSLRRASRIRERNLPQ